MSGSWSFFRKAWQAIPASLVRNRVSARTAALLLSAVGVFGLAPAARAITDIPFGQMVWLQGYDLNPVTPGFQNSGWLRIEAVDDALDIALIVAPGQLVNAPSGLISLLPGAGGSRTIYGDVINRGTINAFMTVFFNKPKGVFDNYAAVNVASYQYVYFNGTNQIFNQYAGSLEADFGLYLFEGTFNYFGGSVGGAPYLINSTLHMAPNLTNAVRFAMTGDKTRLEGNLFPGQSIWLQGSKYGDAQLSVEEGFNNNGSLELSSIEGRWNIAVQVPEGTFTNDSKGRIEVTAGSGGSREIVGDLLNLGSLTVDYDLNLLKTNGLFLNGGQIAVGTNATLTISNGMAQIAGVTEIHAGAISLPAFEIQGGALTGSGSITGAVVNASLVSVSAGSQLAISGSYTQAPAGKLEVELAHPRSPLQPVPLLVTNDTQLAGEISATLAPGYTPQLGDVFTLIKTDTLRGRFNRATLPPLSQAWEWDLDYYLDHVDLRVGRKLIPLIVANHPENLTLQLTIRGTPNAGIVIESSSNLIDWAPLKQVQPFTGFVEILESYVGSAGARFFRAHPAD